MRVFFLLLLLLFCLLPTTYSQETEDSTLEASTFQKIMKSQDRLGFLFAYGGQEGLQVAYEYRVIFFQPQVYFLLWEKPKWRLDLLAQPQVNLTRFKPVNDQDRRAYGYEYGLNLGAEITYRLLPQKLTFYALMSAGPHYVSGVSERQSPGFIFSDNWLVGLRYRLSSRYWLDFRPGFRHISNAGLRDRNGGVNNSVLSLGLVWQR